MVSKRIKIEDLLNDVDGLGDPNIPEHTVLRPRAILSDGTGILSNRTSGVHVIGDRGYYESMRGSPLNSSEFQYGTGLLSNNIRLLNNSERGIMLPHPITITPTSTTPSLPSLSMNSEQSLLMGANALSALSGMNNARSVNSSAVPSLPRTPLPTRFSPLLGNTSNKVNNDSPNRSTVVSTPPASVSNGGLQYKINKPQGRPIIQSIIGKFTMYANVQDLILDITRFDRITLKDALNTAAEPFELVRYSRDDIQNIHKSVSGGRSPFDVNGYTSNVSTQKNLIINEARVYDKLRNEFTCSYLKFIKIIRDKKGKLVRLESVICPNLNEITIDFIKKKICYPRYKSNMKIYLVKCDSAEDFENKFIYIHENVKPNDMDGTFSIEGIDKSQEQFKNLTVWCRNE